MKKFLPNSVLSILFALFLCAPSMVLAQSDTTVFDYDQSNSCLACNDDIIENVGSVTDSILDATPSGSFISSVQVKVKLFTCLSGEPVTLRLNGHTVDAVLSNYTCSCGECDSIQFEIPFNELSKHYLYGQYNTFSVFTQYGYGLYIDRVEVIRNTSLRFNYDAMLHGIDSPNVYSCEGNYNIKAVVGNFGKSVFSGGDIDWTLNGVSQTPASFSNTLDTLNGTGNNTAAVLLGNVTVAAGQRYDVEAVVSNPGGVADSFGLNDTARYTFFGSFQDTLTVGGSSPMYNNIQDAIADLMEFGVCGPTVISVRPGTYNEQLEIGPIPGSSAVNKVMITSEDGDSSSVVINFTAGSNNNYIVLLNNAAHVTFDRVTIEALHPTYGRCVDIRGNIEDVHFDHCWLVGKSTTSTSDRHTIVYRSIQNYAETTANVSIRNCHLQYGVNGVFMNNSYQFLQGGLNIEHCFFDRQHRNHIQLYYGSGVKIAHNTLLRTSTSANFGYGIYIYNTQDSLDILNNRIYQNNGASAGIYLGYGFGSASRRNLIANNSISLNTTGSGTRSIEIQGGAYTDLVYNNVIQKYGSGTGKTLYISDVEQFRMFNNNLANLSGGWAFEIYDPDNNGIVYSDHNNYYTTGTEMGLFYGENIKKLHELQWMGFDSSSVSVDPSFTGMNDLHVYHADLNGNALPFSKVLVDMDGQPRNPNHPDIGSDEFNVALLDAGITAVEHPVADTTCLNIILKNFGSQTLTSVKIDWKLNGTAQTQINWTGSLSEGESTTLCIDTLVFDGGTQYTVKAWTSGPNSGTDSLALNDTTTVIFYPALSGTYTIGGTSPDFADFNEAVTALHQRGISGNVLFKVRSGTYTEQIEIQGISGAYDANDVVFESEDLDSASVILTYGSATGSNNYTVLFNGAQGVTMRHLTIRNTTNDFGWVVHIKSGSKNIGIENNRIENNDSTSDNYYTYLMYMEYNGGRNINIANNFLNRGSRAFIGYSDYSRRDKYVVFKGNKIQNQGYNPIECAQFYGFECSGNQIISTHSMAYESIRLSSHNGPLQVKQNKIFLWGDNIQHGIMVSDFYSVSDTAKICNNVIKVKGTSGAQALYLYDLYPALVAYNSTLNECTDTTVANAALSVNGSTLYLYNNNFVHLGKGKAGQFSNHYVSNSNHNNWFSNGGSLINLNGNYHSVLTAFQSATGQDAQSISQNPFYDNTLDLYSNGDFINDKGTPVNGIHTDITGLVRSTTHPDIGAYEFDPLPNNIAVTELISPAALFKADTLPVIAVVRNFGPDTIQYFTIQLKVNQDTLPRELVSASMLPGDSVHVNLGDFEFLKDSLYNILVYTSLPNGNTDQYKFNDTLKLLNRKTAMSGVYTIGGSSPDFNTFSEAVAALKNIGIADSVRFRVRAGTYNEHVSIPQITGAGARNSIIFESENKDTASVILTYAAAAYDSNYVVMFHGADGVTFRYLKLISTSVDNYGNVFVLKGKSINNSIEHNVIEGPNTGSSYTSNSLIFSENDNDNYLHIRNNIIRDGDYGIYLYGYNGNYPYTNEDGIEITGNYFTGQYFNAIYLSQIDSIKVNNNRFVMDEYDYNIGLHYEYVDHFEISNNQFTLTRGSYAIRAYNSGSDSYNNRNLISSNAVYMNSSNNSNYGMYLEYLYKTDLLNNTIKIDNSYTNNCYNLYMYYGSENILFNNILANYGNGFPVYVYGTVTLDSFNYNNYLTTGSAIAYLDGYTASDLNDLRSYTGFDAQSVSIDPGFKSSMDLHVTEVALNGAAKPFARVTTDMDLEPRDPSHPDIGADEFGLLDNDAGMLAVLVPAKPFLSDTQFVKVALKNFGANKLYSVDIEWEFNGVAQSSVSWNDSLVSGDSAHVLLARKFFNKDSSYSLKVWTSNPNGVSDSQNANDTISVENQYPALSGVYTIGGASPDFNTFTEAVEAMKRGGIVDSVRFDVRNGTYNEQISIPSITGADGENAIVFQSEQMDSSKVKLVGTNSSTDNYVVQLDSANGVTFRYMNIYPTYSGGYTTLFYITNGCKNINITQCNLVNRVQSTVLDNANVVIRYQNSGARSFQNIKLTRNHFLKGSYAIYADGYSYTVKGEGLLIGDNQMEDQYYISLEISEVNNVVIRNNKIFHNSVQYTYGYGINLNYCSSGYEITGNHIYNQEYYGIYSYSAGGTIGDTALIANNFIHTRGNDGNAMILYYPYYVNIYHNNLNLHSPYSYTYTTTLYYPSSTKLMNNCITHMGTGHAILLYGSLVRSDYNNLYTAGTQLGYFSGTGTTTDLAAWKTATGYDASSLSVDPEYTSNTDLHVNATDLNATAVNHKYLIQNDIDGALRDSISPDIGADEFSVPNADDAGVNAYLSPVAPFGSGLNPVRVFIKNFGYDTLKSVTIQWKVNGNTQTSKSWSGSLKSGQSDTVTVGYFNFLSGKKHDLTFWTSGPNGQADSATHNDTLKVLNIYPALKGVYTVEGSLPDFATLGDAFAALKQGGIADTVWFKLRSGTYAYNLSLTDYPGSNPNRPVYIESLSGDSSNVVLTNSSNSGHVIFLNGADNIKFRKISFKPNYYAGVKFESGANGISFERCHFEFNPVYYYVSSWGIYSANDKDDSVTVRQCRFVRGNYGMYLYGYENGNYAKGIKIENNLFTNQTTAAVFLQYTDAPIVKSNTISNFSGTGLNLRNSFNSALVSHNKITSSNSVSFGIYLYDNTGTATKKATLYNNFVAIYNGIGVYLYSNDYYNLYHNSVHNFGNNSGTHALYINSGSSYDIRNNIFSHSGPGYAIEEYNSPVFIQSNYNNLYSAGTYLGRYNSVNQATLADWKSASGYQNNSISQDPSFVSNTDLHTSVSNMDSVCIPIAMVTDDIDGEARNTSRTDMGADEYRSLSNNLGVANIISPANSCGLDSSTVSVQIINYGNKGKRNFPLRYRIGIGSIQSVTITDSIGPGKTLNYQFAQKIALNQNVSNSIMAWTDLSGELFRDNDTAKGVYTNYTKPDSVKSTVPANGAVNIDFPIALSWQPSAGATRYDLYYWKFGDPRPSSPNVSNITQISYQINGGLNYGQKYNWQIVSKNPQCETPGQIKTFTMRYLPDLIVEEVNNPHTAFSSTTISVNWKVKNQGTGASSGSWYDLLYLSADAVFDNSDLYLGGKPNPSALGVSQSYSQSMDVTLPNGISGNYYIFVQTDPYNHLNESNNSNNSNRDTGKMVVSLTPPPDLIVSSIIRPSTVFSGTTASLTYTVKNQGTGKTLSGSWVDRYYLSTQKVLNGNSHYLGQQTHTGNLNPDSTYTVNKTINIPPYISGKYFYVVLTDNDLREYEHSSEGNNITGSDTIKVFLTPPPDLLVENVVVQDTASNHELVNVSYYVLNEGGSSTGSGYYDQLFLSPTSSFNSATAQFIGSVYHNPLINGDTSFVSQSFRITRNINGPQYLFVLTDFYNYVNEIGKEGNNTSDPANIAVISPDLKVKRVIVSGTDSTGSNTPVKWTVENKGKGTDYQGTRNDSIFISTASSWNRSQAVALGRLRYTVQLNENDTVMKTTTVRIPDGFDGNRYFYVVCDASNEIYEAGRDTNNYKRSNVMNVALSPYPDLAPAMQAYPDSASAGDLISIQYLVNNQGDFKAKANWKDRFYLSLDSVFDITKVLALSTVGRQTDLEKDSSYQSTVFMSLPANLVRGNYYYYIHADFENSVYEHQDETNNIIRSQKVFIDGYPPVDLRVNCPTIKDSMMSGIAYNLKYSVTNIGQAPTAVGAWNDGVYLSSDSILGSGDQLIHTVQNNKVLKKDSTYSVNKFITIPNGLSGNFYLIVKTDVGKAVTDIDSSNNRRPACKSSGGAMLVHIKLTSPPDLQIATWDVPSASTSGQPIKVKWQVKNNGTGATAGGAWKDQVFLSTDYTIDNQDYILGEKQHTGNLAVNASYTDSISPNIPINKTGNFIVIIKTDAGNAVYEHTQEGNNTASSITTATQAPPSDLVVTEVTAPDSVISGGSITVSWKVKNQGSNPASGTMRDNVYLSTDNAVDGNDKLLTSEIYYQSLAPSAEVSRNRNVSISGVPLGDYNILVSTDALNNINESNENNNVGISTDLLNVNIPVLPIGVVTSDVLTDGELIYHRIIVPDSLSGESMLITLKADSVLGDNKIYTSFGTVPSGSSFDFKYREPFAGNQEIIIPELTAGTYYLLTTGEKSGTGDQNIQLLARILPFEIRKITPNRGGNLGDVTLLIEGSKLNDVDRFMLLTDSGGGSILPDTNRYRNSGSIPVYTQVVDPTSVYATFDLRGMDTGVYDLVAYKGLEEAKMHKGFTIEQGIAGKLEVSIDRPANSRANNNLSMTVNFRNTGNNDMVNRTITLVSSAGAPIAFDPDDLGQNILTLTIPVQSNTGPPGRLGAGESGSATVYTISSGAMGFIILK